MISLRTIAIFFGIATFGGLSAALAGFWTLLITLPLAVYGGWVAAALDDREGRQL